MQRLVAASLLCLLAACDDRPSVRPVVTLKEFVPRPDAGRTVVPDPVAAEPRTPIRSMDRAQLVSALQAPKLQQGCMPYDPWREVVGARLTPETLTAVIGLLNDEARSGNDRSRLLVLMRAQADNPVALAYWRETLTGPALFDDASPDTLWAGAPAVNAMNALLRHGTDDDRKRLIAWLGKSNAYDMSLMRAGNDDAESSSAPPAPELRAVIQRTFDDPTRPVLVRSVALSTLARLTPTPVEALRVAMSDPVLRKVSIEMFPLWFEAKDLAIVDAAAVSDPSIVEQLEFPLTSWFASHLTGPEPRARLEAVRDEKVPAHFPKLVLMLALWASSQNEPELAKAAHRRAIAVATDTFGMKTAHRACLAALEMTGPLPAVDAATLSWAGSALAASAFDEPAAACRAALPSPPKNAAKKPTKRGAR